MYVVIVTLNKLHVLNNLLDQKWPSIVSDSAMYAELKLWLTLQEIIFLQNMIYYSHKITISHQTLSQSNFMTSFQSKRHWDCFLAQTQNNLEWILFWRNRLAPSSEHLLKTQTVIYSRTLLPRSHVILNYTTLCLFTTVKNWSKKQWMVHAGTTELQIPHYVLNQHCMMYVAALCTTSELQFLLPRQMKQ